MNFPAGLKRIWPPSKNAPESSLQDILGEVARAFFVSAESTYSGRVLLNVLSAHGEEKQRAALVIFKMGQPRITGLIISDLSLSKPAQEYLEKNPNLKEIGHKEIGSYLKDEKSKKSAGKVPKEPISYPARVYLDKGFGERTCFWILPMAYLKAEGIEPRINEIAQKKIKEHQAILTSGSHAGSLTAASKTLHNRHKVPFNPYDPSTYGNIPGQGKSFIADIPEIGSPV